MFQHVLQPPEQRQIDIHAQRRDVAPAGIFDTDRRALDLPTIGQLIGVVGNDLGETRINDARQPEFRRRRPNFTSRKVVIDRQNGVIGIQQVMDDDLAKRRKRLAKPLRDLGHLLEQDFLFFGWLFHSETIYTELDRRSII